jgi:hypothetical protein
MINVKPGAALFLLALFSLPSLVSAAPSPFDIDVKELDRAAAPKPAAPKTQPQAKPAPTPAPFDIDVKELDREPKAATHKPEKKKTHKAKDAGPKATAHKEGHKPSGGEGDFVRYTVKPGDHLFKILVGRFGMSNEAAEKLIPEIQRVNDISNIKSLTVGRTLLIPSGGRKERLLAAPAQQPQPRQQTEAKHPAKHDSEIRPAQHEPEPQVARAPAPAAVAASPAVAAPSAAATLAAVAAPPVAAASAAKPAPHLVPVVPQPKAPLAPVAPVRTAPLAPAPAVAAPVPAPKPVAPPAQVLAPVVPPPPPAPVPWTNTWICAVSDKEPARIVDSLLNALSLRWSKNKILQSEPGAANAFSIRVDRYFERNGVRYIVSVGESDSYSYTLLRLLEAAGYRVLLINAGDDFTVIGEKLLRLVGVPGEFGKHLLQGGREVAGFLVQPEDAEGRRVAITRDPVDPKGKWTLPTGCGYR